MKGEDDSINLSKERIGKTFVNKFGNIATCIEYNTNNDITIQFSNAECTQHTCWKKFSQGKFKSPFDPIKDGGIVGMMNVTKDKETKAAYETWRSMLKRCHSKLTHNNRPTYEKVECCDEWNYFPNFLKWLQSQENYSKWINSSSIWHLDKDILSESLKRQDIDEQKFETNYERIINRYAKKLLTAMVIDELGIDITKIIILWSYT